MTDLAAQSARNMGLKPLGLGGMIEGDGGRIGGLIRDGVHCADVNVFDCVPDRVPVFCQDVKRIERIPEVECVLRSAGNIVIQVDQLDAEIGNKLPYLPVVAVDEGCSADDDGPDSHQAKAMNVL